MTTAAAGVRSTRIRYIDAVEARTHHQGEALDSADRPPRDREKFREGGEGTAPIENRGQGTMYRMTYNARRTCNIAEAKSGSENFTHNSERHPPKGGSRAVSHIAEFNACKLTLHALLDNSTSN